MSSSDIDPHSDEVVAWQEIAPVLDESLSRLAEMDRHALLRRFFEQKKLVDVGRALGLSEEAARKRAQLKRRTKKKLFAIPMPHADLGPDKMENSLSPICHPMHPV